MQLDPSLLKLCPYCSGRGRLQTHRAILCEPCDGSGWVPNAEGRALLGILAETGHLLDRRPVRPGPPR